MGTQYEALNLLKALYVEDDELIRIETEMILGEYFDGLTSAKDGLEALELYESGAFDIVISDVSMPNMNGVELARRIKENNPKQRIIITSSTEDTTHMIDLVNIGINRFLPKPIRFERLLDYLNDVAIGIQNERRIVEYQNLLEKKNEELETALQELQKTQKQLVESEKMASLGQLVSGVAHEMNTPVGICVTAMSHLMDKTETLEQLFVGQQLKRGDMEKFVSQFKEGGMLVQKNLERAARLVQVFKQISIDQHVGDLIETDLCKFIQNIVSTFSAEVQEKNISWKIDCAETLRVNLYPDAYSEIVANLITNALEHGCSQNGDTEIRIKADTNEGKLELVVQDNGRGISQQNIEAVFTPFFTTARGVGKVGLGLSIVYNLVTHKLNGTIRCESDENRGTTFIVTLPLLS